MSQKAHQIVKTLLKINLFRTDKCDIIMETAFVELCVSVSNYSVKMQCDFLHFRYSVVSMNCLCRVKRPRIDDRDGRTTVTN